MKKKQMLHSDGFSCENNSMKTPVIASCKTLATITGDSYYPKC
ncbi:hypothetical protein [Kosmotoga pacifica]|nr:hypothetical protein [Kosmotoga pacifica]